MSYRKILILFLLSALLAGCLNKRAEYGMMNRHIDVFGVQLFSEIDYREIKGVQGIDEPCLRGFERSFDELAISIGYGFDKRVRKIVTRNTATSLFSIKPGMSLEVGRQKALQAGFQEYAPFTFRSQDVSLSLLADNTKTIFGLRLELLD